MKAIDLIEDLRSQLEGVKAQGQTVVAVTALESYLATAEPVATAAADAAATEQALARARHEFEVWKTEAPMKHAAAVEMFKSSIEAGQTALRSLILINGGAAVALLAFLGNVLTKEPPKQLKFSVSCLNDAMGTFVVGVGLAGAAAAARYLVQFAGSTGWVKSAKVLNWVTIGFGIASLIGFFVGGAMSYRAFR